MLRSFCAGGLASTAMDYESICAQLAEKQTVRGKKKKKKQKKKDKYGKEYV